MSYQYAQSPAVPSESQLVGTFIDAMARVYMWMTAGLLLTAITATLVARNDSLVAFVFGNNFVFIGLIVVQFGLVIVISSAINKLAPSTALGLFFVYSGLMGVTLSFIFLVYSLGTIALALGVATATFGAMSIIGLTTKKDLTKLGPILFAGLFGLIIASFANMFLGSSPLDWVISYAGVLIFMGLTIYNTKTIKNMTFQALSNGDAHAVSRIGVMGALQLYLSFINLFLFILRIVGGRR